MRLHMYHAGFLLGKKYIIPKVWGFRSQTHIYFGTCLLPHFICKKRSHPVASDPRSMYLFIFFIREMGKRKGGLQEVYILAFFSSFPERRRCRNILETFSSSLLLPSSSSVQYLCRNRGKRRRRGNFWWHCPGLSKMHHARRRRKEG